MRALLVFQICDIQDDLNKNMRVNPCPVPVKAAYREGARNTSFSKVGNPLLSVLVLYTRIMVPWEKPTAG